MKCQIPVGNTINTMRWAWRVVMDVRQVDGNGKPATQLFVGGRWHYLHECRNVSGIAKAAP